MRLRTGEKAGDKQKVQSSPRRTLARSPYRLFDDKIFYSRDKVTHTFIEDSEVITIHFDRVKRAIYYKGHHIDNMEMGEREMAHLERFRQQIEKNPNTQNFVSPYTDTHQQFLLDHPVNKQETME